MHTNPSATPVFEGFYQANQRPPWDLDGPTPFVVDLESHNEFRGAVLDAGCGTGENALFLAARGHRVVGIDSAPTAIARARSKAWERGLQEHVTFVEADACEIAGYTDAFDTVLDCGFFHVLQPADQARYTAALGRATRPGAVLHLMAFSDRNPPRTEQRPVCCFTHGVSEAELREAFGAEWLLESLGNAQGALAVPGPGQPARQVHFLQARLRRV
jgi:SAM-dependent methyltransferase